MATQSSRLARMNLLTLVGVLAFALLGAEPALAEIIPSERRVEWNPGIPGGIPSRTTICANVTASPYNAVGNGVADDSTAIQNAINACPVNQVVYLPAGTYKITATLNINKGIVLRGAGPTKTKIKMLSATPSSIISVGGYDGNPPVTSITGGLTKGSKSITVSNAASFAVGNLIGIDQLNDPSLVNIDDCTWGERSNNSRALGQIVEVVGKSGNTLAIDPGLAYAYSPAFSPEIYRVHSNVVRNVGIEDLYVERSVDRASGGWNIRFQSSAYCWVKNVESAFVSGRHIQFSRSFRCEVRQTFVHEAHNYCSGANAYGYSIDGKTSETLITDSIAYYLNGGMTMESSGSGNVVSYSLFELPVHCEGAATTWLITDLGGNHCAHPYMNLYEGNIASHISADFEHGSSSHQTWLRNFSDHESGSAYSHRVAVDLWMYNYYMNFVGNVFGTPGDRGDYEMEGEDCSHGTAAIFKLGYVSDGDCSASGNDPKVKLTILRHGNFDYISNATLWEAAIADRVIPSSFYLTSKPDFFGTLPWPSIGPELSPMVGSLPARIRFQQWLSGGLQAPTNLRAIGN